MKKRGLFWLATAGLGLLLALLFMPGISARSGSWLETGWNSFHIPTFFFITVGIGSIFRGREDVRSRVWLAVGLGVLIAISSELFQGKVGRSASWIDIGFDLIGIVMGAVALVFGRRWGRRGWAGFAMLCLLTIGISLIPLWARLYATERHRLHFPDIGGFEESTSTLLWKSQRNAKVGRMVEENVLKVQIGKGRFGGVSYWTGGEDWSGFNTLELELENPGEAFSLGIRVDDSESRKSRSWFQDEIEVASGESRVRIALADVEKGPRERLLDLTKIWRLALFTNDGADFREFVIKSAFLKH